MGRIGVIRDVLPRNRYRIHMEDTYEVIVKDRPALRPVGYTDTGTSAQWVRGHLDPTIQNDTALWEMEHGDTTGILEVF